MDNWIAKPVLHLLWKRLSKDGKAGTLQTLHLLLTQFHKLNSICNPASFTNTTYLDFGAEPRQLFSLQRAS